MATAVTRLDGIVLPEFHRLSWVSSAAAKIWLPAFSGVAEKWPEMVLRLSDAGPALAVPVAARADTSHRLRALAARNGLVVKPLPGQQVPRLLPWTAPSIVPSRTPRSHFLVGRREGVDAILAAIFAGDNQKACDLLSIPRCCQAFHRSELRPWADPWWPLAERTASEQPAGDGRTVDESACDIGLPAHSSRALLRAALGLPTVGYVPCSLLCPHAREHERLVAAALEHETADRAIARLDQIATWPVLWSGLHGIAEIKTPVLKLIQPTDPTVDNLRVRLAGESGIEGAALGVRFPFASRSRHGQGPAPVG
jgi:hypothetical protein